MAKKFNYEEILKLIRAGGEDEIIFDKTGYEKSSV